MKTISDLENIMIYKNGNQIYLGYQQYFNKVDDTLYFNNLDINLPQSIEQRRKILHWHFYSIAFPSH